MKQMLEVGKKDTKFIDRRRYTPVDQVGMKLGMNEYILPARHHPGFTFWPSQTTRTTGDSSRITRSSCMNELGMVP